MSRQNLADKQEPPRYKKKVICAINAVVGLFGLITLCFILGRPISKALLEPEAPRYGKSLFQGQASPKNDRSHDLLAALELSPRAGKIKTPKIYAPFAFEIPPSVKAQRNHLERSYSKKATRETSFTAVARWPDIHLFTFGEGAQQETKKANSKQTAQSFRFPGARVAIEGDPVSGFIGQGAGYTHHSMVPEVKLGDPEHEGNEAITPPPTANFLRKFKRSIARKTAGIGKIFGHSWSKHQVSEYTSLLEKHLLKRTRRISDRLQTLRTSLFTELIKRRQSAQAGIDEMRQAYGMSVLTETMSYVDMDPENVQDALKTINKARCPLRPWRRLFKKPLEHVMTLKFFTPADGLSKAWNKMGFDKGLFGFDKPGWDRLQTWKIGSEGIAHHVHLLKDSDGNGYLTFQGTANVGTYLDLHLDFGKYKPEAQQERLATLVDDDRWEAIEEGYLRNCHTGICNTLRAFVSSADFPLLAEKATELNTLSLVGHSSGGSMASLFAKSVQAVKEFFKNPAHPALSI